MIKNGRQIGTTLDKIREDHRRRYEFAIEIARGSWVSTIADVGCGTGYGSYMMASAGFEVHAYEIDHEAIEYGEKFYNHPLLKRKQADIAVLDISDTGLLTMFEIIEHSVHTRSFLLKAQARTSVLVGSVPNENVVPFVTSKHRQHVRHYTPDQLIEFLDGSGWEIRRLGCQIGKRGSEALVRWDTTHGRTLIFEAQSKRR